MSTDADDHRSGTEITLSSEEGTDWWVAQDAETGVTSQGATKQEALENLEEALAGYHGDGESPSDADLRELGIEPENNTSGDLSESDVFE